MDQAGDRPGREQREHGGEDASQGVRDGCTAAHVLGGQPVDAIGDDSGEKEQNAQKPEPNVARRDSGISLNWISSINSDKPARMAWVCPLCRR